MHPRRVRHSGFRLARRLRADAVRWMAVVVLTPLLVLGTFGGVQILLHAHGGHGPHLHAVRAVHGDMHAGAHEAAKQCHAVMGASEASNLDPAHDHDEFPADPCEDDVVLSVPDHEVLPGRAVDLAGALAPMFVFAIAAILPPPSPHVDRHIGDPGGIGNGPPMGLCALTSCDRLVRTSQALLI